MVYRWQCRQCEYVAWSPNQRGIVDAVEKHLLDHYRSNLTQTDFRVGWECPYCNKSKYGYETDQNAEAFKSHLFEHATSFLESGQHVAEDIGGVGDILVLAPAESTGATNARVHFTSIAETAIFVTTNPAKRVRMLDKKLDSWPDWTTILTTKSKPFADVTGIDLDAAPLDVVILDTDLGLTELGETISRVLDQQRTENNKIAMGFDILDELLQLFDTEAVFKFLHVLNSRLESTNAVTHYYLDPQSQPESSVNVLQPLFDLQIHAAGGRFVSP
jgi:rubredoxin